MSFYSLQIPKTQVNTGSFSSYRPPVAPARTVTIRQPVINQVSKPKAATCIEDLKFKGEFVDELTDLDAVDQSRKTEFTLCITPNNCITYLNEAQVAKLKSDFRKWLDPLFLNKEITKFTK